MHTRRSLGTGKTHACARSRHGSRSHCAHTWACVRPRPDRPFLASRSSMVPWARCSWWHGTVDCDRAMHVPSIFLSRARMHRLMLCVRRTRAARAWCASAGAPSYVQHIHIGCPRVHALAYSRPRSLGAPLPRATPLCVRTLCCRLSSSCLSLALLLQAYHVERHELQHGHDTA